jgi:mRNA-degrading endonuclease toxin of MazEF toxin-antitoxin module
VLDDLALRVNAEDIDACVLMIARPDLVTVQDHIVALAECALELDALARVLGCHAFEVIDEGLLAITDMRVVLDVGRAGVPGDGLSRTRLVKRPSSGATAESSPGSWISKPVNPARPTHREVRQAPLQTLSAAAGPQGENGCYYLGSKTLLKPGSTGLARSSKTRVEQVRSLGVRRLGARLGQLLPAVIAELDKALRLHLGL